MTMSYKEEAVRSLEGTKDRDTSKDGVVLLAESLAGVAAFAFVSIAAVVGFKTYKRRSQQEDIDAVGDNMTAV